MSLLGISFPGADHSHPFELFFLFLFLLHESVHGLAAATDFSISLSARKQRPVNSPLISVAASLYGRHRPPFVVPVDPVELSERAAFSMMPYRPPSFCIYGHAVAPPSFCTFTSSHRRRPPSFCFSGPTLPCTNGYATSCCPLNRSSLRERFRLFVFNFAWMNSSFLLQHASSSCFLAVSLTVQEKRK